MTVEALTSRCETLLTSSIPEYTNLSEFDKTRCAAALLNDLILAQGIPAPSGYWALTHLPEKDLLALNDLITFELQDPMLAFYQRQVTKLAASR